jgi:Lsr2
MATRTVTSLVDDTDGSEAQETVSFGLEGTTYEIDLSDQNAKKLRDALEPWVTKARKTAGRRRPSSQKLSPLDKGEISIMRAWLQEHGHDVSTRGRISAKLRELYNNSAH